MAIIFCIGKTNPEDTDAVTTITSISFKTFSILVRWDSDEEKIKTVYPLSISFPISSLR